MKNLGRTVKGSVFDCNPKRIERALKAYDPLLYVRWNSEKNEGNGCWEVRRRPEYKTLVDFGVDLDGRPVYSMEYKELDIVNHVLDTKVLNDSVLERIYQMDAWRFEDYGKELDQRMDDYKVKAEAKKWEEIRHAIKQDRKYWKQYQELVQSGYNPFWFFSSHRK